MACRVSGGRISSLCLGLLVFVTSHYHCTPLTRLKALDKPKGKSTHMQRQTENQSQQHHGRLLIGEIPEQETKLNRTNSTKAMLDVDSDYQADMGWWQNKELGGQVYGAQSDIAAIQHVLKLDPRVECTGTSMKLLVQDAVSTPASLLFVDRGHLSPLSLSKLPSSCGYSIRSTRRDLILTAPYDGCFVMLEEDSYVLPLRWWGLPVRMSCPLMRRVSVSPPMVTCHAEGMVVKMDWTNSAARIKVNVNGRWEPLLKVTQKCMFGIVEHPEGVVLSVHYSPCLEKKNGLYTLELATESETKISCPQLLPGSPPQSAKDPAKGSEPQTEMPKEWLYSSHSTSAIVPGQTIQQVPGLPQFPKQEAQGQREIRYPEFPYFPYSSFGRPSLLRPDGLPTSQQMNPTPAPPMIPAEDKPQLPAQSPVTKPPGKYKEPLLPNPFNLPPGFSDKPAQQPAGPSKDPDQTQLQLLCAQTSQDPKLQLLCLEKLPGKPEMLPPTLPENPRGDTYQPFYLLYPQQRPASKPTGVSQPQKPGDTQGQMYNPFYPIYTQPRPAPQPAADPQQTQSGPTQSQMYQPFYPIYTQPRPAAQPAGAPQQSQPGSPLGQMYQPFYPIYTQPRPVTKPAGDPQQSQPGSPSGQMYQPFYPIYTQPKPVTKPAGDPQPKPGAPQSPMYQPFYPLFTQPKPVPKPDGTPRPSQPETKPGQDQQNPGVQMPPKPTQPQQPESPRGQMYNLFYPYMYTKPKPAVKPQPSWPMTPQTQVQQPPPPQPKPGDDLPSKPAVPRPDVPQDQWDQQMCLYAQLMGQNQQTSKPPADPKPSTENMQGLFYGPCQPPRTPGTGTRGDSSQQSSQMSIIKPPYGQVGYPNQFYLQQPPLTMPPATSMQQVPAQGGDPKQPDSPPISQTGDAGTTSAQPLYCPHPCPSGFVNCCIQIAFHQHLHIFPPGFEGKDSAQFYPGLPLPSVAYAELGNGLELSSFPQPADVTMQTSGTGASAQSSPQLLTAADRVQTRGQPPEGNPAVLPGSSPSSTANPEVLVYPYFPSDPLYPHWSYLPQNMGLQQGQSQFPSDPSKPWASGNKPFAQYEPYNIQNPEQSSPLGVNNPFSSNFMSMKQFSPRSADRQYKPAGNEQQSVLEDFSSFKHQLEHLIRMPQDAPVPTQNDSLTTNNSKAQLFQKDSKNSTQPEQSLGAYFAPQSYVLLQHGPPGKEQSRFSDSPVPFRDLVHSTNSETLNIRPGHIKPLNFEFQQEKGQQLKWLGEGTFNPFSADNYVPRLDEPGFLPSQSPSAEHLKPDSWKPFTPTSSSQKFTPHVPGKVFSQWSSMADQPANGRK